MPRSRSALPAVLALAAAVFVGLHVAFVAAPSKQRAAAFDELDEARRKVQLAAFDDASKEGAPLVGTSQLLGRAPRGEAVVTQEALAVQASWASPPPLYLSSEEAAAARIGLGLLVALFAVAASLQVDIATVMAEQLRRTFRAPRNVEELEQVVDYVEGVYSRDLNYYVTNPSALFNDLVGYGDIRLGIQCLTGQLFNFAPMTAMQKIIAEKTTGQAPMLPYSGMMANGAIWMTYGLLVHNPAIWVPNIPTLGLGAAYMAIFWNHCREDATWLPETKSTHLAGVALAVAVAGGLALALPSAQAAGILGYIGVVASIVTFMGPLTALKEVLETENTQSLNFELALATIVNCSLWLYYGTMLINDPCIWFPNVLGLLSGAAQLACFAKFGFAPQVNPAAQDFAPQEEELAV